MRISIKKLTVGNDKGFTLAGVLVGLALLLILMTAAATHWSFIKKRAKEEELIFRGEQYARAIRLYYQKFKSYPGELKELLNEKCIRKLYKDPMTEDGEWYLIRGVKPMTGETQVKSSVIGESEEKKKGFHPEESSSFTASGIVGVRSKSEEKSIKEYKGERFYNKWIFIAQIDVGRESSKEKVKKQPTSITPERRTKLK
jgi:type II secretory pathway pseudopilin PulG